MRKKEGTTTGGRWLAGGTSNTVNVGADPSFAKKGAKEKKARKPTLQQTSCQSAIEECVERNGREVYS